MFHDPMDASVRHSKALSWQRRRGYANARRLAQDVSRLAVANGATCLGWDECAAAMFEQVGLGADAIATVRVNASGSPATIAVPTFRTWHRRDLHRAADRVADIAVRQGRNVVLVSPHDVTSQPRLANAGRVCRSMCAPFAGDAQAVAACIAAAGGEASLEACAGVVGPPAALERIFGLMVGGWLEIDLDTALGAESRVRLRSPTWVLNWDMLARHADQERTIVVAPLPHPAATRQGFGVERDDSSDGAIR